LHGPLTPGRLAEVSGLSSGAGGLTAGRQSTVHSRQKRPAQFRRLSAVDCRPALRFNREELWTIADFLRRQVP
jgi:hypothetical protein